MVHHRTDRFRSRRAPLAALAGAAVLLGLGTGAVGCTQEPERSVQAYCSQVTAVVGLDEVLASGDAARTAALLGELRTLRQVAPTEIESQLGTIIGVLDDLQTTAATVGGLDAAKQEVFSRRSAEVPAIRQAGADIETYTLTTCNVTLNATSGTTPGSVPGSLPATSSTTTK